MRGFLIAAVAAAACAGAQAAVELVGTAGTSRGAGAVAFSVRMPSPLPSWASLAQRSDAPRAVAQVAQGTQVAALSPLPGGAAPVFAAVAPPTSSALATVAAVGAQQLPAAAVAAPLSPGDSAGVPEPQSYALFAAGLAAIALFAHRRRRD